MTKVHATRTFAPLQFEALEPHRFEDLVRDLIRMGPQDLARLQHNSRSVFFDIDNEYAFLKPRDVIQVESSGTKQETAFAALTHRFECPVSELHERHSHLRWELQQRLGRQPDPAEIMRVLELKIVYETELDQLEAEATTGRNQAR